MPTRLSPARAKRLAAFSTAGIAGFAVDAGVLAGGMALGLPAWTARVPSFLAAVVTTWSINRRFAFRTEAAPSLREFATYFAAMSVALAANLTAYYMFLIGGMQPLLALLPATAAGAVANYRGARRVLGGR